VRKGLNTASGLLGMTRAILHNAGMPQPAFTRDPDIYSGAAVFPGTRVPIYVLFDYLMGGDDGMRQFREDYEHVTPEMINAVLDQAMHRLTDPDTLDD